MIYPWQTTQWQQLQLQRQEQRLPHALLLAGQAGLGKWDFARALAASLLCQQLDDQGQACGQCNACHLFAAGTHPDYLLVEPEAEDKAIKVDDIRELSRALTLTSQMGGYKLASMAFADNMNINAANSLLKTLEEPSDHSVLLLVSSRPHRLPITVRSRCQQILFQPPEREEALQWLQHQGQADADNLLRLAHGSPLLALRLGDETLVEQRKLLIDALLGGNRGVSVSDAAGQLAKCPLDPLLGWLYDWLFDLVRVQQCDTRELVNQDYQGELRRLAPKMPLQALYGLLDEVLKLKSVQSIPLNPQLLWEDLLISWERLITRA